MWISNLDAPSFEEKKTALYLLVRFQLPWLEPQSFVPGFSVTEPIRTFASEANEKAL
jgi:hypothetical protein